MCAKAISPNMFTGPSIREETTSLVSNSSSPTLGKFGETLSELTGTSVSVLGEDYIRIFTPNDIDDDEIRSLREFIANSLFLPVNIFREKNYIEILAI